MIELGRVLAERIRVPRETIADIERLLREQQLVSKPGSHLSLGLRDADDEWIVASVVAGGADALVTGDADILDEKDRVPLPVFSPREFWLQVRI